MVSASQDQEAHIHNMAAKQEHTCGLESFDVSRCAEVETPQVQEDKKQRNDGDQDVRDDRRRHGDHSGNQ